MKTKIYTLLFFTLTLSSAGIFNSCRQPSNCGWDHTTDVYYNVSDANKAKIPYTGNDTLVFKSDAGDTAILYGQGKKTTYTTTTSGNGIADCGSTPQYTYYYENLNTDFIGTNTLLPKISFSAYMYDKNGVPEVTSMKFSINNIVVASKSIEYISSVSHPEDSIIINGIYHSGVYMDYMTTLFNYKDGILKFKDSNNKTWTKIQ